MTFIQKFLRVQLLVGLAVPGSLFLLAGCATRNSSSATLGSNQVPVMVTSAGAGIATNTVEKSGIPHQFQATARPRVAPLINSPFNGYDSAIVEAIEKKWYDLLDAQKFTVDRLGKVVVGFHLHSDGTVSDVKTLENNVGDVLGFICTTAVADSAPFGRWPPAMVKMVGRDYREITFTFYYQ